MTRRYDRYAIVAMLLTAGCDLVFPPGNGPASDATGSDATQTDGSPTDGSPFVDSDGDGVYDDTDNCRSEPNADQMDAEPDGVGDACDNCMFAPNFDQLDEDSDPRGDACDACPGMASGVFDSELPPDGLGDACDPNPCDHEDHRLLFDGFNIDPAWATDSAAWMANPGEIHVSSTPSATRYVSTLQPGYGSVMASFKTTTTGSAFKIGVVGLAQAAGLWNGVRCVVFDDGQGSRELRIENNGGTLGGMAFGTALEIPTHIILSLTPGAAGGYNAFCELRGADGAVQAAAAAPGVPTPGTYVGLFAEKVDADFHWIEVSERTNNFAPVGCTSAQ